MLPSKRKVLRVADGFESDEGSFLDEEAAGLAWMDLDAVEEEATEAVSAEEGAGVAEEG